MVNLFTFFSAFTYGLSSSLTLCLATCLPVYLPILFGYGKDAKTGLKLSLGFGAGRFAGYFILGAVAAVLGAAFIDFFSNVFPKISSWFVFLFGLLTVFYGTLILAKAKVKILKKDSCKAYLNKTKNFNNPTVASGFLGLVSTITPCVPVFTFLLLPFALGKVWETALITVAFGLGANVVFIVIAFAAVLGVKDIERKFHGLKRRLEIASSVVLIVAGLFYVLWSLGPAIGLSNRNYVLPNILDFYNLVRTLLGA